MLLAHIVQGVRTQSVLRCIDTRFSAWLPVQSGGRLIGLDSIRSCWTSSKAGDAASR